MTETQAIQKARDLARQVREYPSHEPSAGFAALAVDLADTAEQIRDPEHNGWANYPTWAVNLWLSNDAGLYEEAREITRAAIEAAPDDENTHAEEGRQPIWTVEQAARFRLADTLKTWVRDELAPDLGATFAADLLGYSLDLVEWDEIAEAWISGESE